MLLSAENNEFILENSGLTSENTVILSNETYTLEAVENGTLVLPEDTDTEPSAGLPCIVVVVTIVLYTFFS